MKSSDFMNSHRINNYMYSRYKVWLIITIDVTSCASFAIRIFYIKLSQISIVRNFFNLLISNTIPLVQDVT